MTDMRERVARVLCISSGGDPDRIMLGGYPQWHDFVKAADAAIEATGAAKMLDALKEITVASKIYLDCSSEHFNDSDYDRDGGLAEADARLSVVAIPNAQAIITQMEGTQDE